MSDIILDALDTDTTDTYGDQTYTSDNSGTADTSSSSWLNTAGNWLSGLSASQIAGIIAGGGAAAKGIQSLLSSGGGSGQKVGYTGGIPAYQVVRNQVPGTYDPNRRAGSSGQQYFTDVQYVPKGGTAAEDTAAATAAQQIADQRSQQMAAQNASNPAKQQKSVPYAEGGITNLAKGTYLDGATDGMADKIPASIEDKQPAKLSHGEFVISADVVSALGSGNSNAGAKVLYDMMDRVRKHAHGTKQQIKPVNLKKVLPA